MTKLLYILTLIAICVMAANSIASEKISIGTNLNESDQISFNTTFIDITTGCKYIKKDKKCYQEFNRKGELNRTVATTLPRLSNRTYVKPVSDDCYLLYYRYENDHKRFKTLPATMPHPEGWILDKVLVSLN